MTLNQLWFHVWCLPRVCDTYSVSCHDDLHLVGAYILQDVDRKHRHQLSEQRELSKLKNKIKKYTNHKFNSELDEQNKLS